MTNETKIHLFHTLTLQFREQNSNYLKGAHRQEEKDILIGDEGKDTNLWVFGTELARIYPIFNYVLTLEMSLRSNEGRQKCTANMAEIRHGIRRTL